MTLEEFITELIALTNNRRIKWDEQDKGYWRVIGGKSVVTCHFGHTALFCRALSKSRTYTLPKEMRIQLKDAIEASQPTEQEVFASIINEHS